MPSVSQLLGPASPLARSWPGYEVRGGQLSMALAVERTLAEDGVLLCEAGTGTGKTLAYLVPAILSGRKVVVSTATRALQEQIFSHDLPLIRERLKLEPRACLMKGLSNYVCLRRYEEFRQSPESLRPGHARALQMLESFVAESETGDVAELAAMSEDDPIWSEVLSSSDTRVGPNCPHFEPCFVTRMKREAAEARLIVVNHHLFFADLALRGPHPAHVIPDYDAVIFDEAHRLEDVATDFFSVSLSSRRVERVAKESERALTRAGLSDPLFSGADVARVIEQVLSANELFFRSLGDDLVLEEGRTLIEPGTFTGAISDAWFRLDSALESLGSLGALGRDQLYRTKPGASLLGEALELINRRADQLRRELALTVEGAPGRVTWFERGSKAASLSSSPVDVAAVLRERVFSEVPAVVLTSATLATSSPGDAAGSRASFEYLKSRVGLEPAELSVTELCVGSPFDFENHALLYTPHDLPPPRSADFLSRAALRVAELVEITDGGCFVLTTSVRSMRALDAELKRRLSPRRVLCQGEAPKAALLSAFRASGSAVLVATLSFWEGVDVAGRALRSVVLEKVPFLVPSDPIVVARSRVLEEKGENPFLSLSVPAAAITLKQGFGRLIRTASDVGIVTLLDERVHRRGYGKRLLDSLPPARRTDQLSDVRVFWSEVESAR